MINAIRDRTHRTLLAGAALITLGAGAAGGAVAVGTDAAEPVTGAEAERAKRAAIGATGGGRVVGVERDDGAWQVKVVRDDRGVERSGDAPAKRRLLAVNLSGDLQPIRVETR